MYEANAVTAYSNGNFAVGFVSHGIAGGLTSAAAGGSFDKGFRYGAGAYTALVAYQDMVDESPKWSGGKDIVYKPSGVTPYNTEDLDTFVAYGDPVPPQPCACLSEGCGAMEDIDSFPGANAGSAAHDVMAAGITQDLFYGNSLAYYLTLDVPTMPIAIAISYGGLMTTPLGAGIAAGKEASGHQ
jgi:hypothetical protein